MNNSTNGDMPKGILKTTMIICSAIMAGTLIFVFIVYFLKDIFHNIPGLEKILPYVACIMAGGGLYGAFTFFRTTLNLQKDKNLSLAQKLNKYRSALILFYAFCEGPALFATITYMLTGLNWVVFIVPVMLLVMGSKFPTKQRVVNILNLDWQEQQEL